MKDFDKKTKYCIRCIMNDRVDTEISFNTDGLCKHCQRYDTLVSSRVFSNGEGQKQIQQLAARIKSIGHGKEYDCIIGVSGGVDSSYVAYLVKSLGLRPLAIHFDNGWDSELAVKNIEQILQELHIDLFTYVVNWPEFRNLQISFLRASTPDGEVPTDHAISALLWQEASKRGIKYIISGMNFRSEAIWVPKWSYGHSDWRYIKAVHKKFGRVKLKTYPHFSLPYLFYVNLIKRIRIISILNYIDYDKEKAKRLLTEKFGWRSYGGKHHESLYTRFYQGVFLPQKFSIDKRYGHFSDLINSGQMTREEALLEVKEPAYDEREQASDREYVIKKLGLSEEDFQEILTLPIKSFSDYKNSYDWVQLMRNFVNRMRSRGLYPK